MRPADIEKLIAVGRPAIASDGAFAVFATSRPDLSANRTVGQLWRVELTGGEPRRLTRGVADASPQLSPDDTTVGFLRVDGKGKLQVFVVGAGGGEPVQVTDVPLGVGEFDWSGDGSRIAFTARVPEKGRYGTVEGLDAAAEPPRHITGIRWNANGLGYIADRPAHVFAVDVPPLDAEPFYEPAASVLPEGAEKPAKRIAAHPATQLTSGTASHSALAIRGDEVLAVIDEIETDQRDLRSQLVAVRLDGSGQRELLGRSAGLTIGSVSIADDGTIALLASESGETGRDFVGRSPALWVLEPDAAPRRLTDPEAIDLGEVASHITAARDGFLLQDRTRGRVRLIRVTRSGEVSEVLGGDVEVNGHAAGGGRVVVARATPASFGELAVVAEGEATSLTAFAAPDLAVVMPKESTIHGRDGYPVHGWVARPDGDGPFPVLLQIHGGPYASYGIHLFDETQVLVTAGYAVVYCNPRGSAGYGAAHGRSIKGAMGTVDLADVLDFLEGAIAADDALDGSRVGILGGSYGGYLTAWAIAHDHRFAGAIVERGFLDPVSFQGTSDIGSFFGDEYVGTDDATIARQSPMAIVGDVTTPTLVIHSELDWRCPLEQATRYYAALKRQGTEAEMLIFPGEDHELTRSGSPRHRVERFDAVLDWWRRHLPVD